MPGSSSSLPKAAHYPRLSVSRCLAAQRSIQGDSTSIPPSYHTPATVFGVSHKLSQITSDSITHTLVHRSRSQHHSSQGVPPEGPSTHTVNLSQSSTNSPHYYSLSPANLARTHGFYCSRYPNGSTSHESNTMDFKVPVDPIISTFVPQCPRHQPASTLTSLVDTGVQSSDSTTFSTSRSSDYINHRCFQPGLGNPCQQPTNPGNLTTAEANHQINFLELRAIRYALFAFQDCLSNKVILIQTDNQVAMWHLNKQGGTGSYLLCQEAAQIWAWALSRSMITERNLPGGSGQCDGGQPQPDLSSSRMVPKSHCSEHDFTPVRPPTHRPLCVNSQPQRYKFYSTSQSHNIPEWGNVTRGQRIFYTHTLRFHSSARLS
ncbi:uncharacterized protein LOC115084859 isoform X1 [Rhinatrema bivittatum]|uniref:uncharacterized protein LOC115084859 isoform X1 n=1 Tax=Rhinatrema bivittatum TaxID=194408 RepID=UPI00112CDC25|nr:uncharacterized protein LOC115084859 isoform X1 [Rhinatrema bivittatum]